MIKKLNYYAYHGTSKKAALQIIEKQDFSPAKIREDHWLGQGSYFFREDEEQALTWSRYKIKNEKNNGIRYDNQFPCTLEIFIDTLEENCLNLDTRKGLSYLSTFMESIKTEQSIEVEISELEIGSSKVACYFLSLLPENIFVVQRTFDVPSRLIDQNENLKSISFKHKEKEHSFNLKATQICIRNNKAIDENSIKIINEEYTKDDDYKIEYKDRKFTFRKERLNDEVFNK